jgi:hypothetical protein
VLTLSDLIRRARSRLDDAALPYLWTDQDLTDYINDALWDAALRANLTVQDEIPVVFTQTGSVWNARYALPSGILDVKSVYLNSAPTAPLERTSIRRQEQVFKHRPTQSGSPWGYALDMTKLGSGDDDGLYVRAITFLGTPDAADTAYLDVVRLPVILEGSCDIPEIDPMWQSDLMFGVTALAYLKNDTDTYNPQKSARDFLMFEERFGPRLPAVVLRERQTDVPLEMIVC